MDFSGCRSSFLKLLLGFCREGGLLGLGHMTKTDTERNGIMDNMHQSILSY